MIARKAVGLAFAASFGVVPPALAQRSVQVGAEVTNDEVRRGLSWSGGRASASADALVAIGPVEASARIAATRGSARYSDADGVADLVLGTGWDLGAIRLRTTATGHLFTGVRSTINYVEFGSSATFALGPAQVSGGAIYAPSQDAIGGDNLYLHAGFDSGLPGTPFTAIAGIGHSSGDTDDPVRARRLRPVDSYTDWRLGVEYRQGRLTLGLSYIGTDVDRNAAISPFADARHAGDKIVGRARIDL